MILEIVLLSCYTLNWLHLSHNIEAIMSAMKCSLWTPICCFHTIQVCVWRGCGRFVYLSLGILICILFRIWWLAALFVLITCWLCLLLSSHRYTKYCNMWNHIKKSTSSIHFLLCYAGKPRMHHFLPWEVLGHL